MNSFLKRVLLNYKPRKPQSNRFHHPNVPLIYKTERPYFDCSEFN